MGWLNPDNFKPIETDPEDKIGKFLDKYGDEGMIVLNIIGDLDPLRIYEEEDDYDSNRSRLYVEKAIIFMEAKGDKKLLDLKKDEVKELVEDALGISDDMVSGHIIQQIQYMKDMDLE